MSKFINNSKRKIQMVNKYTKYTYILLTFIEE